MKKGSQLFKLLLSRGLLLLCGVSTIALYHARTVCAQDMALEIGKEMKTNQSVPMPMSGHCHSHSAQSQSGKSAPKSSGHSGICCNVGEFTGSDWQTYPVVKAALELPFIELPFLATDNVLPILELPFQYSWLSWLVHSPTSPPHFTHISTTILRI